MVGLGPKKPPSRQGTLLNFVSCLYSVLGENQMQCDMALGKTQHFGPSSLQRLNIRGLGRDAANLVQCVVEMQP